MAILGMVVALQTFNSEDAGTDDEIYLGMWGTGGGREFPLSSANHDDFERNADDFYILGVDPGFGFPMHRSERSAPGQDNDPALLPIDINSIQYVYLRKQAYGQDQDDDAWRLESAIVLLYDDATLPLTGSRLFSVFARKGMWMGNEHGHQVWLSEPRPPGVLSFFKRLEVKAAEASKIVTPRPRPAAKKRKK
ncbi:MAG TPA: hypothetical protein VJT80_06230 [Steroidobacteraceae bacterium]|nr:hypothetical protein [Steroidobacteraceae bacterium]